MEFADLDVEELADLRRLLKAEVVQSRRLCVHSRRLNWMLEAVEGEQDRRRTARRGC